MFLISILTEDNKKVYINPGSITHLMIAQFNPTTSSNFQIQFTFDTSNIVKSGDFDSLESAEAFLKTHELLPKNVKGFS